MAVTPARYVSSGFYRVHLYVLMGMNVLVGLVALSETQFDRCPPFLAAVLSYVGAVCWLYEKPKAGTIVLYGIAVVTFVGALLTSNLPVPLCTVQVLLGIVDVASGGMLLGFTIAAMFLGHWYLNSPTMDLEPLKRLVLLVMVAVVFRMVVSATGLSLQFFWSDAPKWETFTLLFITLRWSFGLLGSLILAWMSWATLKIPNTQSATGILYVGVIATFLGELTAQLLSVDTTYPV